MAERPPPDVEFRSVPGRSLDAASIEGMLEVIRGAFDRWPPLAAPLGHEDYLRWKLHGPPEAESTALLGFHRGRPAVASISLAQRYAVRGHERRARLGADSAVHPEFQGRGFDSARRAYLVQTVEPEYDLSLSYSDNPRIVQGGHRYGEAPFGEPVDVLYRSLDHRRSAAELRASRRRVPVPLGILALSGLAAGNRVRFRRPRIAEVRITSVPAFDERATDLGRRALAAYDFVLVRDAGWLNWRFADRRAANYSIRVAEEDDRLVGYAVTRVDELRGYLVDLLAEPNRTDVAAALAQDAIAQLRSRGVAGVSTWMPARHAYHSALRGLGFFPTGRNPGFALRGTVRDEAGDGAFLQRRGFRAHLQMADGDFI